MATIPSRPLVSGAFGKMIALMAGGGTMMAIAGHAKTHSAPPDADGTSYMRRDRAEAKEYFSGMGKATMIPAFLAVMCVPMLYGWPRGAMLDTKAVDSLSSDAVRAVQELGVSLTHSAEPETAMTFIDASHLRAMPRAIRSEVRDAARQPDKRELYMTQITYALGGSGLFGGLLAAPVIFGDDHYDTRHFPKGTTVTTVPPAP